MLRVEVVHRILIDASVPLVHLSRSNCFLTRHIFIEAHAVVLPVLGLGPWQKLIEQLLEQVHILVSHPQQLLVPFNVQILLVVRAHFLYDAENRVVEVEALAQVLLIQVTRNVNLVPKLHIVNEQLLGQLNLSKRKLNIRQVVVPIQNIPTQLFNQLDVLELPLLVLDLYRVEYDVFDGSFLGVHLNIVDPSLLEYVIAFALVHYDSHSLD